MYLPLFLILVALILRGAAIEYRVKSDSPRGWDRAMFLGSLLLAFLWGVAFTNIVRGVPLDTDHEYTGSLPTLLNPYALLGGLATLTLFTLNGALFLTLRTEGDPRARAAAAGRRLAWVTAASAAAGIGGSLLATLRGRDGWVFAASAVAIVATLFGDLWPNVMPALDPANSLTVDNAASSPYTLTVMTWVAVVFTPLVPAYRGWTYWIFRRRLTGGGS